MLKKVLKITGIVLLALILILFIAPYLFKGKIITLVKSEINKTITAQADFKDVDISFFRHFPRVSVALEDLQVVGRDEFARDTLISAHEIDVALNLFSVLGSGPMNIYSVNINEPRIHALVTKEGKANWDIMKEDTTTTQQADTDSSSFQLNLQHYAINNGYILYDDASAGMRAEIINLNHEGSGDFTSDLFTLKTSTKSDAVTFYYAGIPYFYNTKTAIDADFEVDNSTSKYSFKTDEVSLNDLKLSTEGFFQLVNDSTYNMDISFKTPSNDFKSILSLVPAVYQKDFDKIKTSGKAAFDGFVKGTYDNTHIPAYKLNLEVTDGFFQYPDLPQPVKNIQIVAHVDNPDGVTDHTVVDIPSAHIEFGNDPFDLRLLLKNPETAQWIDAAAKGSLDLSGITKFVKLDQGTKLGGQLQADIQAKGTLAAIEQQKAGEFSAKGYAAISNLYYASADFPQPIQNTSARINIDNPDGVADHTVINIPSAHVELGKDAADLTLLLKTPASDPYFDGSIKGGMNLANVAQFYTFDPGTSLAGTVNANVSFKGKKSMIDNSNYDAIQMAGTVNAANINYVSPDYPDGVKLNTTQLTFNPKNVTLNSLVGSFMGTNFNANGTFDNLVGYAMKDEPLAGSLTLKADKVDLNKLMGTEATTATDTAAATTESTGAFAVPKNISFTLNTSVDEVTYDNVSYKDIKGALVLNNQTVTLKDMSMDALGGTIGLNGSYSTKESTQQPAISLAYDVKGLDVQKTFYAFNTVQQLMPIGKFLDGKITSQMEVKGRLGEDMFPNLATLTGDGSLFLLEGALKKFQPLEKLASTLQISDLQNISLKDVKTYFEFANGKVLVKPFTVKVKDIEMQIGGMHGLDQSLDYAIDMKVPREKLGAQANALVNNLITQANSKGIPVQASDVINLRINVGGSISNPTIKTDMKEAAGSLTQELKDQTNALVEAKKAAADSTLAVTKQAIKDSLDAVKKQAAAELKNQVKEQLFGKDTTQTKDSSSKDAKTKAEDAAKGILNNLLKKKKDTTKN